ATTAASGVPSADGPPPAAQPEARLARSASVRKRDERAMACWIHRHETRKPRRKRLLRGRPSGRGCGRLASHSGNARTSATGRGASGAHVQQAAKRLPRRTITMVRWSIRLARPTSFVALALATLATSGPASAASHLVYVSPVPGARNILPQSNVIVRFRDDP